MSANYGRVDLWAKPVKKRTKHNLLQRRADLITVVFAVVLLIGISVLSYHLMEKPILRIKDRIAGEAEQRDTSSGPQLQASTIRLWLPGLVKLRSVKRRMALGYRAKRYRIVDPRMNSIRTEVLPTATEIFGATV